MTYFLGGNTARGFYSCYSSFCSPEKGNFLYVIKGGPGCGKSSFMRRIANHAESLGLHVEIVLCSGDPDSVDGIYIPEVRLGYVDGTSPHTLDVPYPAIYGSYLDLGQFYNIDALAEHRDKVMHLYQKYRSCYAKAYRILSEIPRQVKAATARSNASRFLSAITWQGIYHSPVENRITVTQQELQNLMDSNNGWPVILHPLWPEEIIGIQTPDAAYLTDCIIPDCTDAVKFLHDAKTIHDDLEAVYNPHVDFSSVYALADTHIQKYL